jgi:hypothetical protein
MWDAIDVISMALCDGFGLIRRGVPLSQRCAMRYHTQLSRVRPPRVTWRRPKKNWTISSIRPTSYDSTDVSSLSDFFSGFIVISSSVTHVVVASTKMSPCLEWTVLPSMETSVMYSNLSSQGGEYTLMQ